MRYTQKEIDYFKSMRVAILSPLAHIEPKWVRSVVNMTAYSWQFGLKIYEMGELHRMVVHWARNELAKTAVEAVCPTHEPYTHFLWLDSDHVFHPYLACQLARHMANEEEAHIVSALYYARSEKFLPVAYVKDFSDNEFRHFPILEVPDTLCQVDAIGFGGVLTRREVFEKVPYPWFRFDKAGEDIYFCVEAKKAGFNIFLDGQMKMGHIGDAPVVGEPEYKQYLLDHAGELGDRIRVGLGGKQHGTDLHE